MSGQFVLDAVPSDTYSINSFEFLAFDGDDPYHAANVDRSSSILLDSWGNSHLTSNQNRTNAFAMTLLITEIHPAGVLPDPVIIFAADRRISSQGRYHGIKKKLFAVPSLRAGLGFFGLAEFSSGNRKIEMSEWLKSYIVKRSRNPGTLEELAHALAGELNSLVPRHLREKYISGFHLAGISRDGMPEFWFIRNVEDDRTTLTGTYSAREDFITRDAPKLITGDFAIYRNGDIRGHVAAWELFDQAFVMLLNQQDFHRLKTSNDYANWLKFKMEVLSYFYKKYSRNSVIGRPIDTLVIKGGD